MMNDSFANAVSCKDGGNSTGGRREDFAPLVPVRVEVTASAVSSGRWCTEAMAHFASKQSASSAPSRDEADDLSFQTQRRGDAEAAEDDASVACRSPFVDRAYGATAALELCASFQVRNQIGRTIGGCGLFKKKTAQVFEEVANILEQSTNVIEQSANVIEQSAIVFEQIAEVFEQSAHGIGVSANRFEGNTLLFEEHVPANEQYAVVSGRWLLPSVKLSRLHVSLRVPHAIAPATTRLPATFSLS